MGDRLITRQTNLPLQPGTRFDGSYLRFSTKIVVTTNLDSSFFVGLKPQNLLSHLKSFTISHVILSPALLVILRSRATKNLAQDKLREESRPFATAQGDKMNNLLAILVLPR